MGATSIYNADLNRYFSLLTPLAKESVLTIIRSIVETKTTPSDEFLQQYNQEIDEAVARVRSGQFTSQGDLENEMKEL